MKKIFRIFLSCLIITGFIAVGSAAADAPKVLSFASKPMGGAMYYISAGMAAIWSKYAGVQVRVETLPSIKQWGPLMKEGQVDLAMDNAVASGGAYRAKGLFSVGKDKLTSFRMVAAGHKTWMALWTRPDTGIKSIQDLEGKKVVPSTPPGAPNTVALGNVLLDDYYKLAGKYTRLDIGSPAECTNALIEGRIDAYVFVPGPHIEQLRRSVGVLGIPTPKEAAEYVGQHISGMFPSVIPKGMYGLESAIPCVAWNGVLCARETLDADLVYHLLTVLYSHLDELHGVHPTAKQWVLENATQGFTVPFHPGSIKFLKEKGLWTQELERKQQENLAAGK